MALADEIEAAGVARPVVASTLDEALESAEIDLVVICSPSGLHVQLAETAIAAGRHVVIEKPLDVSIARARRISVLAHEAAERGLVVSIISQHRFDPANALVAQAAHDGRFGRLTSGVASIGWWRSQDYYDSGEWRGTWALDGGGAVMNQGVHTVDLLVWMLGRPVEISAQTGLVAHERIEVEDVAVATIRFESGALAVVHATTAAYPGDLQGSLDKGNQAAGLLPDDQMVGGPEEKDHFLRGHTRQYDDIVEAIREGRAPRVTVDDALLSLATVKSIYVAATLGRPVLVDEVLTGVLDDQSVTVGVHA